MMLSYRPKRQVEIPLQKLENVPNVPHEITLINEYTVTIK